MRALGPRFQQTVHLQLTFASSLASHPLLMPTGPSQPPPSLGALVFPAPHPMPHHVSAGPLDCCGGCPRRVPQVPEVGRSGEDGGLQRLGEAAQGARAPWSQAESLGGQGGPPHSLLAPLPSRCRRPGPVLWVGDGRWWAGFWEGGVGGDDQWCWSLLSSPPPTSCGPRIPCSWKAWAWIWN